MRNPFLIIRFIFFFSIIYMNVLSIVFASWTVGEVRAAGLSTPGASVFIILNGCATFAFVAAGLAELFSAGSSSANVTFECGWTAIFSVLHLGAAVAATVTGPPSMCQPGSQWGVCASSFVLVPVSWLCAFTVLAYSLMLIGTTIAHMHAYPLIWWNTVYTVPWFTPPAPDPPNLNPNPKPPSKQPSTASHDSFMVVRYLRGRLSANIPDAEGQVEEPILFPKQSNGVIPPVPPLPRERESTSSRRPMWAKRGASRRGRDAPFALNAQTEPEDDIPSIPSIEEQVPPVPTFAPPVVTAPPPLPMKAPARRSRDHPFAPIAIKPAEDPVSIEEEQIAPIPTLAPPPSPTITRARRGRDAPFPPNAIEPAENTEQMPSFPLPMVAAPPLSPTLTRARRGMDRPFPRGGADGPTVPPATARIASQRRSMRVPQFDTRPLSPQLQHQPTVNAAFSQRVDQDAPIPLPRQSEWIRADSDTGAYNTYPRNQR